MLTFLQVRIEIKKREKASCNFVVKLWLYYGSKKKKGPKIHVWCCGLGTYFKKLFVGRQHIKADEYQMAGLGVRCEITNN